MAYLANPDSPGCPAARRAFATSRSTSPRGVDGLKDHIKHAIGVNGLKDIINARMPRLREYPLIVAALVAEVQYDHIYSNACDAPENLFVDFQGPNGHFSDYRNMPGKAARYTAEVMMPAAAWFQEAIFGESAVASVA